MNILLQVMRSHISYSKINYKTIANSMKSCDLALGIERNSSPEVFYDKGVLINFAKFTGKHVSESLLVMLQLQACNFIEKRFWHRCFPVKFVKLLRIPLVAASVLMVLLAD